MWLKRRRYASGTPKNFLIQEEDWFKPPRQHWKKGSETIPPCSQLKQQYMSYTLSQLLWVLLTGSIDMETKKDPNTSLELISLYGHTLLQSEHDELRSAHAENKDHLCLYTTVAKIWLWAGTQYHVSRTASKNHKLGSPRWTYAVIL